MSGNSIERLLDKIDADISDFLIFAGAIDNNAKLISFRKGKASFSLPNERQDTLDVQMSLMFSLIRQFEDISGPHKFTVARFVRYDIFLFGTPDMHVFVLTLPTSESRVAKTLTEMVATFGEAETHLTALSFTSRNNDKTMAAALAPAPLQEPQRQQKFSTKLRPEVITMLQGYLMALDPGCTIHEDAAGFKIKPSEGDRLAWLTLEKISSTFKDRLNIDHIGTEANGGVFVRISLRQ